MDPPPDKNFQLRCLTVWDYCPASPCSAMQAVLDAGCSYACLDVAWSVRLSVCLSHGRLSPARTAKPIEMPMWQADSRGSKMGVHMGATWRIQLNDPCSAATQTIAVPLLYSNLIFSYCQCDWTVVVTPTSTVRRLHSVIGIIYIYTRNQVVHSQMKARCQCIVPVEVAVGCMLFWEEDIMQRCRKTACRWVHCSGGFS